MAVTEVSWNDQSLEAEGLHQSEGNQLHYAPKQSDSYMTASQCHWTGGETPAAKCWASGASTYSIP